MSERVPYDEFGYFHENAEEMGLALEDAPLVRRESVALGDGRQVSALVWGNQAPDLVFLHGGAQNAHTWDSVAIALGRPLVAIDLPGHGHSDGPRALHLDVGDGADDVAVAVRALAPDAKAVVGMSLGGLVALALADRHPDLVRGVVLVDVTPGVTAEKSAQISAFVNGPKSFASFEEILARTVEFNPTRSVLSLRRGILHNAEQQADGSWVWRYARHRVGSGEARDYPDFGSLWGAVKRLAVPLLLVRGMRPQSVVGDDDERELLGCQPSATVVHVEDAGHSVQGDAPLELARLLGDFVAGL